MIQEPKIKTLSKEVRRRDARPVFSLVLPESGLAEIVHDPAEERTGFAVWRHADVTYEKHLQVGMRFFVPYSPHNSLIENEVILLPASAEEYESEEKLLQRITGFLHRYVDLGPIFEKLAGYYVLLSWIYDSFNELPYLRVRGDTGSGKTRFLLTLGSLCYKPIFASGASTVSPLFRILHACRGTLVMDEGDFRHSDEKAEIIKILNQGHARGFPVLRSEVDRQREFSPRAYQVFGPKIIATRGLFEDRALESRCLTEVLSGRKLRQDIPINLTEEHKREALEIRNQLLMFRFRNHGKIQPVSWVDRRLEPRLNQVFSPLMSVIGDAQAREELRSMARQYQAQLISDRGMDAEAQVLEVIRELEESALPHELTIKEITNRFIDKYENDYDRKITPRWIGGLVRQKLSLGTERRQGRYAIASSDKPKLKELYERYGLTTSDEVAP